MDRRTAKFLLVGLAVTVILAGMVSFYANSSPDGLERVAGDNGFAKTAKDHPLAGSPVGDYGVKGVADARLSGGLAGLIGVTATLVIGTGVFWVVRRRTATGAMTPASARAPEPASPARPAGPAGSTD